jgi:ubiquinone/menaquinone biosynthesis C-methylase UbiE
MSQNMGRSLRAGIPGSPPFAPDPHENHDDVVRRSFDRQVGLFSGPDSPFARRPEGALAWLEPLADDMLVLDVACGAGHAAETVAPEVREVVGIDLTATLLELGAARLRDAGITNVLLQEGNAEALPFVAESFDLVFCRSALHHMADPRQAVAEMVRTCRPGGRVVLSDLLAPSAEERDVFDRLHQRIDPSHVRAFLEDELGGLLPDTLTLTYGDTSIGRMPVDIAFTEQSEVDTVLAAFRAELDGGERTGFDPQFEDGKFVVSFRSGVVHGTRE